MIHLLLHPLIHLLYLSQQALCPEGCQTQQRNIRKYSVIATHRNRSLASKSGPRGHRRMKKHVMTGLLQQKEKKNKNSVFAEVDVANTRRRTTAEFKTRPSIVLQVRCDRPTTTATAPLRAENGSCSWHVYYPQRCQTGSPSGFGGTNPPGPPPRHPDAALGALQVGIRGFLGCRGGFSPSGLRTRPAGCRSGPSGLGAGPHGSCSPFFWPCGGS